MDAAHVYQSPLYPYRLHLFALSVAGLAVSLAALYSSPTRLGFFLIGPLAGFPWALGCYAMSKFRPLAYFFLTGAAVALLWPLIILI
jgi:hypothetical protein